MPFDYVLQDNRIVDIGDILRYILRVPSQLQGKRKASEFKEILKCLFRALLWKIVFLCAQEVFLKGEWLDVNRYVAAGQEACKLPGQDVGMTDLPERRIPVTTFMTCLSLKSSSWSKYDFRSIIF